MEVIRWSDEVKKKDLKDNKLGEWFIENDIAIWKDEATGYMCVIHRNKFTYILCGYVGLPDSHPLYDQDYMDVDHIILDEPHGGVTFSERGLHIDCEKDRRMEDLWFFGFDCNHCFDHSPRLLATGGISSGMYRNWDYVLSEVKSFAKTLYEIAENEPHCRYGSDS